MTLTDDELRADIARALPALLRLARSLVRDDEAAADLLQDAAERAWRSRSTFRGQSSVHTWLRRIVHNLAIDRYRRPQHEFVDEAIDDVWSGDDYTVDAESVLERAELRAELEDALAHLPFQNRAVVVLHDVEGLTTTEIADVVGAAVPAIKQRLRRGRMQLVSALASGAERRAAMKGVPLRCWDARQLVSDYLDGHVDASDRAQLERHLATCPTCPPLYASLVGVRAQLDSLRDRDSVIPPHVRARLDVSLAAD